MDNYRACTHLHVVSERDVPEHCGTVTDHDAIAECRVALPTLIPGATQSDALIQQNVIPYFGGFTNDNTHAVVNKQALTNLCARMNLDAGEKAGLLGND